MNKKIFKRSSFLIAFYVCVICLFTSCIDSVQTVTIDGNNVESYYKISVPTQVLEIGELTEEDFFNNFKNLESVLPSNSYINEIKNNTEVGIEFRVSVNNSDFNEITQNFLPYLGDSDEAYIPFLLGMFSELFEQMVITAEEGEFGEAMLISLDSIKCRVMVSKDCVPYMETAFFMCFEEDMYYEVPFYDYGEYYCVEIPLSLLACGNEMGLDLSKLVLF